jgi:hypothetical protein
MATGTMRYWNGESGWIRKDNVANMSTVEARDVMVLREDVTGTPTVECAVSFDDGDYGAWRVFNVQVT